MFGRTRLLSILVFSLASVLLVSNSLAQTVDDYTQEWINQDSASTCDRIGWEIWSAIKYDIPSEDQRYGACGDGRGSSAACGTIEGNSLLSPSSREIWVGCYVDTMNLGSSTITVSLFDYSLIDHNGQKYEYSVEVLSLVGPDNMMGTTTLRKGQRVSGFIGFAIPSRAEFPLVLEIAPISVFSDDPSVIVIAELTPFGL